MRSINTLIVITIVLLLTLGCFSSESLRKRAYVNRGDYWSFWLLIPVEEYNKAEASYFWVNKHIREDGTSTSGTIQVSIRNKPLKYSSQFPWFPERTVIAVPAGEYQFSVDNHILIHRFEAGKCYAFNTKIEKIESKAKILKLPAPSYLWKYNIDEENNCGFRLGENASIRLFGVNEKSKVELIESINVSDEVFSSCSKDENGRSYVPFDLIRNIAEQKSRVSITN